MTKNQKPKMHHEVATNISGNGSNARSQSPDSDQKPVADPINTKDGVARTNGRSTGPRTAQGKERSKFNALKRGLYSKVLLLEGESRAAYLSLLHGLLQYFQPQGILETALVENLAALMWRMRRLLQAESAEISEKIAFIGHEIYLNQYAEAWDRSRAPITSGGLLKVIDNPIVIHEAIVLLRLVKETVTKFGFHEYSQLLRKLYGQNQGLKTPLGLCFPYELFASIAKSRAKSKDKSKEDRLDIEKMVELIDREIDRLKHLEEGFGKVEQIKIQYKSSAALIPGQGILDHVLRYETHLSREIDKVLNRLERLQKLRRGQPLPPEIDVNIKS